MAVIPGRQRQLLVLHSCPQRMPSNAVEIHQCHGIFPGCSSPRTPGPSPNRVCSRRPTATCWMRGCGACVTVHCSISYDHCHSPFSLPFVISSLLLNWGCRSALGTRGSSSMSVSVGTGCLPVARGVNHSPPNKTCCPSYSQPLR